MSQFLTRAAFGQFSPQAAQLPFSQFGIQAQQPTAEQLGISPPAIDATQGPTTQPTAQQQPIVPQNPFSPAEMDRIRNRFTNIPSLFGRAIF